MKSRTAGLAFVQDLAREIVEGVARVPRELTHEATGIGLLLEDERGERESCEPTLGPLVELLGVTRGELNAGPAKEGSGLAGRDAEISCPQLHQVAVGTEPGNWQARVAAARDDKMDRVGSTFHEITHRVVARAARQGMPVLEHEDDGRTVGELLDEERKPCLGDGSQSSTECCRGALADASMDGVERGDHMAPQPRGVGVPRVERDPREGIALCVLRSPLGEKRRLPVSRRRADERERPLPPAPELPH